MRTKGYFAMRAISFNSLRCNGHTEMFYLHKNNVLRFSMYRNIYIFEQSALNYNMFKLIRNLVVTMKLSHIYAAELAFVPTFRTLIDVLYTHLYLYIYKITWYRCINWRFTIKRRLLAAHLKQKWLLKSLSGSGITNGTIRHFCVSQVSTQRTHTKKNAF